MMHLFLFILQCPQLTFFHIDSVTFFKFQRAFERKSVPSYCRGDPGCHSFSIMTTENLGASRKYGCCGRMKPSEWKVVNPIWWGIKYSRFQIHCLAFIQQFDFKWYNPIVLLFKTDILLDVKVNLSGFYINRDSMYKSLWIY